MSEIVTPGVVLGIQAALSGLILFALTWLGHQALALYEKVSKAKVSTELQTQLQNAIRGAAGYADELISKYAKGLVANAPVTGTEKMAVAIQYLREQEPVLVKDLSDLDLQKRIEGVLPVYRVQTETASRLPDIKVVRSGQTL